MTMAVIPLNTPPGKSPLLEEGWLRVLLFGVFFILISVLITVPALILMAGMKWEDLAADPLHVITNLLTGNYFWLAVLLEGVISLLSVGLFRVFIDRRSLLSLGLSLPGNINGAAAGFFTGTALVGTASLLLYFSGHFRWTDIVADAPSLFLYLGLLATISFSEELVFRGYILNNLMESFNKWTALAISGFLFALFHISNPSINPVAFANLALAGALMGVNYLFTKNCWFSILLHFSWNFFQGPVLGFRVSGLIMPSLLKGEAKGDLLLTGGDFGLEGSILITAITMIIILLLTLALEKKYGAQPGRMS